MVSRVRRPSRSISHRPTKVKIEIGDADADGLEQGRLRAEAGHLEDARREVEDRVDPRQLIEERDEEREQDRHAQPHRPEAAVSLPLALRRRRRSRQSSLDLRGLASGSISASTFRPRCAITFARQQPPRTLRQPEAHHGVDHRRESLRRRASSARRARRFHAAARWRRRRRRCRARC